MSDEKTDNTDEPTKAELHDRVRELESTVEKLMPSRRDALKLGAAGLAGAAGLGAASQSADASTGSAGTIGSTSDRPTIFGDDIDANSIETDSFSNTNLSVGVKNVLQIFDTDNEKQRTLFQHTNDVAGSATEVLDFDVEPNSGGVAVINGGGGNRSFTDLVVFVGFASPSVVGSANRNSSPGRSYSTNARSLELTFNTTGSLQGGNSDISAFAVVTNARD